MLGAEDKSEGELDDDYDPTEPLFDTDAEFSEDEAADGQQQAEEEREGEVQDPQPEDPGGWQHVKSRRRAGGITRPVAPTKEQLERHYAEGHANYLAGCECCLRCRGRADGHFQGGTSEQEYRRRLW